MFADIFDIAVDILSDSPRVVTNAGITDARIPTVSSGPMSCWPLEEGLDARSLSASCRDAAMGSCDEPNGLLVSIAVRRRSNKSYRYQ